MQEELYIKIQNDKQDSEKELTQAEYNELSSAERASGKLFFITDQGYIYKNNVIYGGMNSPGKIFKNGVQYGQNSHARIYKNGIEYAGGIIIVEIPQVTVGTYTYNGSEQGPTVTGLDTEHCTVTNATKTLPGTYTMTISLNDTNGCVWSDGTTTPKTYEYTIKKVSVALPVFSNMSYQWDGSAHSPTVTYNSTYCNISGNGARTDVGSQTVTVSLKDTSLTMWTDGTTANKTATFSITKASVALPTFSNMTYTYDGNAHSPTVTYNSTYCNISGNDAMTDAGSKTVTVSLKNTTNTQWSDGTIAAKTATFTINKADLPLTIQKVNRDSTTRTTEYVEVHNITTGEYVDCGSISRLNLGYVTFNNPTSIPVTAWTSGLVIRVALNVTFYSSSGESADEMGTGIIYPYDAQSVVTVSNPQTQFYMKIYRIDVKNSGTFSTYNRISSLVRGRSTYSSVWYRINSITVDPGALGGNYKQVTLSCHITTRYCISSIRLM